MGNSMNVAGATSEIGALSIDDAKKVFNIIVHKIQRNADIGSKPNGVDGLIALAACHKELELGLVEFVELFDCQKVGPWICTGWDKAILTDAAKERLEAYYTKLVKDGGAIVKAALKTRVN